MNRPIPPPSDRPGRTRGLPRHERDLLWVGTVDPRDRWGESLDVLLDEWREASRSLTDAVHLTPVAPPSYAAAYDALIVLSAGTAAAHRITSGRWVTVRDALTFGAEVRSVARALALTDDEVRAGLRSWADGQLEHGLTDRDEHARVVVLIEPDAAP